MYGMPPGPATSQRLSARISVAGEALVAAREDLQSAVDQARAGGLSWAGVGEALGVSRQAAWTRFRRLGCEHGCRHL